MPRRAKPADPYPTVPKVDQRLAEIATVLASRHLADAYRATLQREADELLERRTALTMREKVQTG